MLDEITRKEIESEMKGLIKALQDYAKFAKIWYKTKALEQGYSEAYAEKLSTEFATLKTAKKILELQERLPEGINLLEYI